MSKPSAETGDVQDHNPGDGKGSRPHELLTLLIEADLYAQVLADIRQRIADGEARPVLARHMQALGLDDVLLALALAREG
jgi:hypothetical protein